jgi:hypothetical protein
MVVHGPEASAEQKEAPHEPPTELRENPPRGTWQASHPCPMIHSKGGEEKRPHYRRCDLQPGAAALPLLRRGTWQASADDLSSSGNCERNSAEPKARRAEPAGMLASHWARVRSRGNLNLGFSNPSRVGKDGSACPQGSSFRATLG